MSFSFEIVARGVTIDKRYGPLGSGVTCDQRRIAGTSTR